MKRFNVEQRFDNFKFRGSIGYQLYSTSMMCKALLSILFLSLFHFARRAILFLQPPHKVLTVKCLMASKDSHHQWMMIIPNILATIVIYSPYSPIWSSTRDFEAHSSRQKTKRTIVQSSPLSPPSMVLHDERLQGWVNHQSSTFGDGALAGLIQDLAMAKNLGRGSEKLNGPLEGSSSRWNNDVPDLCLYAMYGMYGDMQSKKNT